MRLYDLKKEKIVDKKAIQTANGILYVAKLTKKKLFESGFAHVQYEAKPNRKYYTHEEKKEIVDNVCVISYEAIPRDLQTLKDEKLSALRKEQQEKLAEIDWYWQRELKIGKKVPPDIQSYAEELYSIYDIKQSELENIKTIEDFIEFDK